MHPCIQCGLAHRGACGVDRESAPVVVAEIAWLIERTDQGYPSWWTGADWTTDPNQAVRFARAVDAQRVIATHGQHPPTHAIEHMWG